MTNSIIRADMPYADGDLVPVGMIAVAPSEIVVHPSVPAGNLKECVRLRYRFWPRHNLSAPARSRQPVLT